MMLALLATAKKLLAPSVKRPLHCAVSHRMRQRATSRDRVSSDSAFITGNLHEPVAHCSSCEARVRLWPWIILFFSSNHLLVNFRWAIVEVTP